MTPASADVIGAERAGTGLGGWGGGAPVVAVQGLTKVFKDFWLRDRARAVDNLSFEIYPREIFGLLGPNGSGKSTTIKLLLGLLKPTRGRVSVFGKQPTDVVIKKRIGYLPEESYLYGFLNARETLDYYGKLFEIDYKTRQKRIDELLDMIGLTGAQFRAVREYSKGMQRRIGIAQALINDPDFLILDEPTTGLDPVGTRQVKDLIIELGRRGKTILLSSHLLADVEDCVTRMVVLYGGQKREEGTCDSLLEKRDRMAIELDALDEGLVDEIDRLVRQRTGGERSVLRVSKPRQKLEDFFLDIVKRAREQQVATSGATSGGTTAEFLRAREGEGAALIERLTAAEPEPSVGGVGGEGGAAGPAGGLAGGAARGPMATPAGAGAGAGAGAAGGADTGLIDALVTGMARGTGQGQGQIPARPSGLGGAGGAGGSGGAGGGAGGGSASGGKSSAEQVDLDLIGSLMNEPPAEEKDGKGPGKGPAGGQVGGAGGER